MKNVLYLLGIIVLVWVGCSGDKTKTDDNSEMSHVADGNAIFKKNCTLCHGADGKLEFNGAKDLTKSVVPLEERINQITNGKKLMTPFKGVLTEREIKAVAEYTLTLNPDLKK